MITYAGGYADEIHAYFARPIATEPTTAVPGIVAVHHMPGWDEFYREFSERLARHGYSAICPDLYCRLGHGAPDDIAAVARVARRCPRRQRRGRLRRRAQVAEGPAFEQRQSRHHRHVLGRPSRAAGRIPGNRLRRGRRLVGRRRGHDDTPAACPPGSRGAVSRAMAGEPAIPARKRSPSAPKWAVPDGLTTAGMTCWGSASQRCRHCWIRWYPVVVRGPPWA